MTTGEVILEENKRGNPKGSGRTYKTCWYHVLELKGDLAMLDSTLEKHFGFNAEECNRSGRQKEDENDYKPQGNFIAFMGTDQPLHSDFDPWLNTDVFAHMPADKVNMNYETSKALMRNVGTDENTSWRQK